MIDAPRRVRRSHPTRRLALFGAEQPAEHDAGSVDAHLAGRYGSAAAEIKALDKAVAQATEQRKDEHAVFLQTQAEGSAAVQLIEAARSEDGVQSSDMDDDTIVDRAILIMVNEAARCLDDGVVDDPEALDIAMVMGTGFAPFRGGLLRYADERGVAEVKQRLDDLTNRFGDRFRAAPMIERIARNGGRFYRQAS